MNKYHDKSDFEINKAVADFLKKEGNLIDFTDSQETHVFVTDKYANNYPFDPCNNPADAMPIINEYGISLMYKEREFQVATNDGNYYCCMSNPLKAAMVIFLMMKDAENEKV
ncbi:phage protein NinX family protein [Morganella morganii]|uniref:phage protein NinX family protein n=1 Tax=Morganella morganii TaxID=582 RepID=UPI000F823BC1|nr:phage protein NinX family protein [Morganella morganii]MBT0403652.1 DUF2591 family protein [Morganella morganii subsp. morganii]RTY27641.1 DUF2591 domain-containing protein [Morganella morganii subsp. morganii]HEI8864452.1 DUF2591 family protein [Morganella morganii]